MLSSEWLYLVDVVVARVVEVVAQSGGQHNQQIGARYFTPEVRQPNQPVHLQNQTTGPSDLIKLSCIGLSDNNPLRPRSHHLGDAEAVPEVVEGDAVVVAVDLEQEVLQDVQLDVQRRQEVQVGEHHLQQHQHLRLLPLPVDTPVLNHCSRPLMTSS